MQPMPHIQQFKTPNRDRKVTERTVLSECSRTALSESIRKATFPGSTLTGDASLLIMPNVEAANITYNLLAIIGGEGVTAGPFLLGAAKPVHVLTPAETVRRIINMTAVASANRVRPPQSNQLRTWINFARSLVRISEKPQWI